MKLVVSKSKVLEKYLFFLSWKTSWPEGDVKLARIGGLEYFIWTFLKVMLLFGKGKEWEIEKIEMNGYHCRDRLPTASDGVDGPNSSSLIVTKPFVTCPQRSSHQKEEIISHPLTFSSAIWLALTIGMSWMRYTQRPTKPLCNWAHSFVLLSWRGYAQLCLLVLGGGQVEQSHVTPANPKSGQSSSEGDEWMEASWAQQSQSGLTKFYRCKKWMFFVHEDLWLFAT